MKNEFEFLQEGSSNDIFYDLKIPLLDVFSSAYSVLYALGVVVFTLSFIFVGIVLAKSRRGTIRKETKEKLMFIFVCMIIIACICEIVGVAMHIGSSFANGM